LAGGIHAVFHVFGKTRGSGLPAAGKRNAGAEIAKKAMLVYTNSRNIYYLGVFQDESFRNVHGNTA